MKLSYSIILLALLAAGDQAAAQKFVNGDLEANSPCGTQIRNFQFNTFMYGAGYGFGNTPGVSGYSGEFYLSQTSGGGCVEGPAQKGSYFLGLASYTSGLVDAMSLRLDAPLVANKTYTLSFYTKMSRTGPGSIGLQIGYTTDSLNMGTIVGAVNAPVSTSWVLNTVNFKPTVPTRFITVRAIKAGSGGNFESFTFVDNFTIAVGTSVTPEQKAFTLSPYPNPFTESFRFKLDPTVKLPCTLAVTDMTGRIVMSRELTRPDAQIERGYISPGVYLLSVQDAAGAVSHERIVAR